MKIYIIVQRIIVSILPDNILVKVSTDTKCNRNPYDLNTVISNIEKNMIIKVLEVGKNNKAKIDRLLNIPRSALYLKWIDII